METYRIHGDNIIECERITNIIINILQPSEIKKTLIAPSTLSIEIKSIFENVFLHWKLILLPGFNKNTKKRWQGDIFEALKEAGGFFYETPDVIISKADNSLENEKILVGIEFCSALQAGNQAWQRSARAFSVGRTGCPYLYVVDFVKYELDKNTRERKNLRFPNAAIPYSYINYSKNTDNFIAQLYIKSEEFDKNRDFTIQSFDEDNFAEQNLGIYIVKLMLGMNTADEQEKILNKNLNVVAFLAKHSDEKTNLTANEWEDIYKNYPDDIVDYSIKNTRFGFHKTIAAKSQHGNSANFIKVLDALSLGFTSKNLPFGIIPANKRLEFAKKIFDLYPNSENCLIDKLGDDSKSLIVTLFKGFKPRGDDNRPDRGLLPFISMLSSVEEEILTFIYGPILETNINLLNNSPLELSARNGLWRSILALSNFLIIDSKILSSNRIYNFAKIYETTTIKNLFIKNNKNKPLSSKPMFSNIPVKFGEDDVDTGIHYFFNHILNCFEGICNPPGGDWSGLSIIYDNFENRWLSLPRVSDSILGKRPDHVFEIFDVFEKPLLLIIESKENPTDLETDVGNKLVNYVKTLMNFIPSVNRSIYTNNNEWKWADKKIDFDRFEMISAAAYLGKHSDAVEMITDRNCEIFFIMNPIVSTFIIKWEIEIISLTPRSQVLKDYIISKYKTSNDLQFCLK